MEYDPKKPFDQMIEVNQILDNNFHTDVLVIGGGIAGCFAAIKASEEGANVILVDKGFVGKSGQSPYATGFMVFNPDWGHDFDDWMEFINQTSEYVNDRDWTEITIKESYKRFQELESWGILFSKDENGDYERSKVPPGRTDLIRLSSDQKENFMLTIRRQVKKNKVKILDRVMITELIKENERIVGAVGFGIDECDFYSITSKTTIIATGACGFKPAGYPPIVQLTCDGEAMAFRAGAEILGKEFVDTHSTRRDSPIGIPNILGRLPKVPKDLHSLLGPGRGSPEVNSFGDELPERPTGSSMYRYTYLEREFEILYGHGPLYTPTDDGYKEVVGGACLGMSLRKADGLWPKSHNCESSVSGLYAAGDSLGNSQNGAVYALSGSSIMGSAITGSLAGSSAAIEAKSMEFFELGENKTRELKESVFSPLKKQGGVSPRWVTQLLQNTMMPYFVSYIKKEDRLTATLTMINYFRKELIPNLIARDAHELRLAHETKNLMFSAEMRLKSSIFRTESRGNHYREDFPYRDDENWLAWVKICNKEDEIDLIKVPIPEKWHPDKNVPYSLRYPFRIPNEKIAD